MYIQIIYKILFTYLVARCSGGLLDPSLFKNVLDDVANNGLGVNQIQDHFNSLTYTDTSVDGSSLATEISSSLSSKFNGPIQALKNLKTAIEAEIGNFRTSTSIVECCQARGMTYSRFRSTVNMNEACITKSKNSPSSIRYPNNRIVEVMKNNYQENPELKWQYLGTEDGILMNYPSFNFSTCRDYDPRFRPFYVSSATPVEKDVVIVIDKSGSMNALHQTQTLIQIAKQAANTVLKTLSPNDRFTVIAFSSGAEVLGSRYRECIKSYELSEATPMNIKFIEGEINRLSVDGKTNYEAALDTAFKFFEKSQRNISGESREKVILFLTDGEKTAGGDPLSLIAKRNGDLENEIVILTYGLGASLPESAKSMLTKMADQSNSDSTKGEIQTGIFEHIKDPSKLRSAMASYYNKFSKSSSNQEEVIFTVPYYDMFGLGLLTTLCLPLFKSDHSLFGVVCSDLTMSNLVSDITYFRQGENSYSFIIDGRGRTLMHPLLPLPSQASDDPIYVDIQHLERQSDAKEVISSMKSGISGSKTFFSTRTFSRGSVDYEGIHTKSINSTYTWTPVPRSNFSLCIVAGVGDRQSNIKPLQPRADTFFYHRTDLADNTISYCNNFNRYSSKDRSSVMITPGGFINPTSYLEMEETSHEVEKYTNFLTGVTSDNPGFRPTIINSVTATFKAEEIWRNNIEAGKRVIWRYLGTTDGVVRIFPGIQLPKNYDITRRPWYERSNAYKGKMVLSTPYNDLWGSGFLITLSTAITEPGSSKRTMAIAGTDFTMSYLYNTLITIPEYEKVCNNGQYECFLIDDSGFIVLHRDFVQPSTKHPHLENVHLTYKEPAIADDLVSNNVMVKSKCIDFENIKEQYSYRVTTSSSQYDRLSSYAKYEIRPVENTNIFIIIKRKLYIPGQTICCKTYGQSPSVLACKRSKCDCLCYTTTNFNYCLNEYELLADAAPTCAPRTPALETESISEVEKIKGIQRCFLTECEKQTSMRGCHGISGCSWCSKDKDVKPLASPYCTRQENCYFGIEGLSQCPSGICEESTKSPDDEADDLPVLQIVFACVIACVIAVGSVFVILGIFMYKMRHTPHRSRADRNAAGNTNIASSNSFARENHAFDSFQQNQNNGGINSAYYDNRQAYIQPSAPMHNVTSQHIAPPTYDESQRSHAPYIFYQGRYK